MLTADLVRVQVRNGRVLPRYVKVGDRATLARAEALIRCFEANVGAARARLDEACDELLGDGAAYALHRGLVRVLEARGEFGSEAPVDAVALRRHLFEAAARRQPLDKDTRRALFDDAARTFGIAADVLERALFSDLAREERLQTFASIAPQELLERYNVAVAQAVLLRAVRVTLTVRDRDPARYRHLFRAIKFHRLMHTTRGSRADGYTLVLDGPMSLFGSTPRYGLALANFLPSVLHCEDWSLEAEIAGTRGRAAAVFRLDPSAKLRAFGRETGVYVTEEERIFAERFARIATGWSLERDPQVIDLDGQNVLVPDFVLRREADAHEVFFEIVGYWRRGYLDARLALLREHAPRNLLLAISERLRVSDEELGPLAADVISFRDVIPSREVLARAERIALPRVAR